MLLLAQVADLVPALFSMNEDRGQILDFLYYFPDITLLSILSSPTKYSKHNLFNILNAFTYDSWILISISFIIMYGLTLFTNNSFQRKKATRIIFDFVGILYGRCNLIMIMIPGYF